MKLQNGKMILTLKIINLWLNIINKAIKIPLLLTEGFLIALLDFIENHLITF